MTAPTKGLAALRALGEWAQELLEQGQTRAAAMVAEMVAEGVGIMEGRLTARESSDNLQQVTGAQLERRGKAIAKAKSAKSDDPLWKAITASKWGSQERYARERLKVSPGSLSAYRSGATPCPKSIALKVQTDLGVSLDYWSKPPRSLVD